METRTNSKVLTITFVLGLVMITCTQHKAVVVGVFSTKTPLDFLHLFLEAARSVTETLEHTCNGGHIVIVFLHAVFVVVICLSLILLGVSGHKKLVQVCTNAELVVLVEWNREVATQAKIGGDELRVVASAIGNLRTNVADVETPAEAALAIACHKVSQTIESDIGGKCLSGTTFCRIVVFNVGKDETEVDTHGERFAEHAAVTCVDSHLIGPDGHVVHVCEVHFTKAEVTQRCMYGTIVSYSIEARQVGKVDVVHQFAKPRRVADANTCAGNIERIFSRVPIL